MAGMNCLRLRPRFAHILEVGLEEAREHLVGQLRLQEPGCEVKSFPGYICLRIPEERRHYWSPRLTLGLEPVDGGHTRVHGIYGPNVNMWASFLYGYLIVGSVGMFSGILGGCQWVLGLTAWGLWVFSAMLVAAVGMCAVAWMGRRLAAPQTAELHRIYESSVGHEVKLE